MSTPPEHGSAPDEPSTPAPRRTPKRGAFPTPKSEIENATPYVPDLPDRDDDPEVKPDSPADADGEEEG